MKKTALFAGLVLASVLGAQAADIYSANVVGYTKVDLKEGYNMLASQFVNLGDEASFDINDVIIEGGFVGYDTETFEFNSKILLWSGTGYTTYGWVGEGQGWAGGPADNSWVDLGWGTPEVSMPVGDGYWIQTTKATSVTFAGQVAVTNEFNTPISIGYNMIANPFPQPILVQDIKSTDFEGYDSVTFEFNTQILLWSGTGYTTYGWVGEGQGWSGGPADNSWVDLGWNPAAVEIAVGEGFWIQAAAPTTITFTK